MRLTDPVFFALEVLERGAAWFLGKGYGAATIAQEVAAVLSAVSVVPKLAIDVGGNVGDYSRQLRARVKDLEIHIFEPAAVNCAKLAQAFAADRRVTVNPVALSEQISDAVLYSNEAGGGLGSLANRRLDHFGIQMSVTENVQAIRFEDYWKDVLQSRVIDIAKLDIEGFELGALRGFGRAIASTRVVQFEFGGCNLDTRTSLQDFYYFFSDAGFALHRITLLGLNAIRRYRELDEVYLTTNFIAINTRMK